MVIGHPERHKVSTSSRLVGVLVVWVAFYVRAASLLSQGLWRDEVDQWHFAFLTAKELIANLTRPGWNGPLYSLMLRGWITITGDSVYAMRFLSVLFGVLSVAIAHSLACRLTGRRQAWITALLLAVSPYMVWYAQEIKMYTWVPLLVLLALYATDRATATARACWWWVVFGATTLAVYSHILAALLIPVLGLWFWLHPSRASRAWVGGIFVAAGLVLPYLPLLRWQAAIAFVPRETGFPARSLGQMVSALANGWSAGISQGAWGTAAGLILMIAVSGVHSVFGVVGLLAAGWARRALRLVAWIAVPLFGVWLVSLWSPIFTDRYLIWSAPAFYTLVAAGVVVLRRIWRPLSLLGLGVMLVYAGHGLVSQATVPIKPQFDLAADYVAVRWEPGDLLFFQIPYNRIVYEVYGGEALGASAEAPYTNWRDADGVYRVDIAYVAREMRRLTAGYDRIWMIYSESELWDDRELVRTWLDNSTRLQDEQHYAGVSLYLYGRPSRE